MADRRPEEAEDGRRTRRRAMEEDNDNLMPSDDAASDEEAPILPIPISEGARLTYATLLQRPAQPPVPETYTPVLQRAILLHPTTATSTTTHNHNYVVLDWQGQWINPSAPDAPPPIDLVAQDDTDAPPALAYAWLPNRKPIPLSHAQGWGVVRFSVVYFHHTDDPPHSFRAPNPNATASSNDGPTYVAIKMLRKAVVDDYLARGGPEHPYKEICRYQELGDNVHVIRCEALEDDAHLFIITPKCTRLVDVIFQRRAPLSATDVHAYMLQMLRILTYLEAHQIHHRDLSPDNLVFLPSGQLVLMDLAMSLRIPVDAVTGLRSLIQNVGNFGTPTWMAPEIYHKFPFDGVAADQWCVLHIFYNMLTMDLLYRRPYPADWCFKFFILAGGLTDSGLNEAAMEVLQEVTEEDDEAATTIQNDLMRRAMAHMSLAPAVRQLLRETLQNAPHERWTLGQVLASDYVVHGPPAG